MAIHVRQLLVHTGVARVFEADQRAWCEADSLRVLRCSASLMPECELCASPSGVMHVYVIQFKTGTLDI